MGLIATSKFGVCARCGGQPQNVKKRGKDLLCFFCCNSDDNNKQLANQIEKQQVRSLGTFQREEGIVDSIQELIIDLDRVVSRYVRLAAMGKDHKCDCYTCTTRRDWKKMHLGHYVNRQHLGLRWEGMNNKVQCPYCNINLRGNLTVYADNLEKEQSGIVEWLKETSREVAKPTKGELKQLLFHYQQKLKLVETKLL